jgi:hypothetical protein
MLGGGCGTESRRLWMSWHLRGVLLQLSHR